MAAVTPRHVLCVLGNWTDLAAVEAVVREVGGTDFELDHEFSQLTPDGRMKTAFEASYDRVKPSMTPEDWRAIQKHSAVAYVLSPPLQRTQAAEISGRALLLTAALLRAGGVAAKGESAGIAHGRAQWLTLATDYTEATEKGDTHCQGATLYWAWVRRPLVDEAVYYTCGLHLLGERDIEIESSVPLDEALEWLDLFGLYLVADRPPRRIKDGEGFRLNDTASRRVMRLAPCERYAADEFLFNPYGYIRLERSEDR